MKLKGIDRAGVANAPHLATSDKRASFASCVPWSPLGLPNSINDTTPRCTVLHIYQIQSRKTAALVTSGAMITLPFTFASFACHRMQVRPYVCMLKCDSAPNPGSEHHRSRNDVSKVTLSAPSQPQKRACISVASYE